MSSYRSVKLLAATVLSFEVFSSPLTAGVRVPRIFGDNMVLQRGAELPVWGWADKGEEITVSIADRTAAAKAGDDGRWKVVLGKLESGGPLEMSVRGSSGNTIKLKNVLVGEVWLASGQSNMEMPVEQALNSRQEIAAASYPNIRLFQVPKTKDWLNLKKITEPADDCEGRWVECSPKTVGPFSAAAYYFGRQLHKGLGVPVGMINSSVSSTRAEFWTSRATLDSLKSFLRNSPWGACHYNAMIAPLIPFAIRGAIWYQGESNFLAAKEYRTLLPALIANWRAGWGQGDFPFGIVQLAPFSYRNVNGSAILPQDRAARLTEMWESQVTVSKKVPNCGLVVTTDIGDLQAIHCPNKQEVGRRLSLWALAKVYGKNIVCSGPLYRGMRVEGGKVRIEFDHADGGLASRDGRPLDWFTVAGADCKFFPAKAEIDGRTVVVSSEQVAQPAAVRFGWSHIAQPNLVNKEGLPASPFRTDDWKLVYPGPTFNGMKTEGDKIRIEFENYGGGLTTSDGKAPSGFMIAGADRKFVAAKAEIVGDFSVIINLQRRS